MSPVVQDDVDLDTHTSGMSGEGSPLHRKFSEPMHSTTSTHSQSPPLAAQEAQCSWCGIYLEVHGDDELSKSQVLKEHIATVHPHIAKFSMYDGDAGDGPEDGHSNGDAEKLEDLPPATEDAEDDDAVEDVEDGAAIDTEDTPQEGDAGIENVEPEGDGLHQEEESDQLPGFSHEQDAASVDKRLHHFWNIHYPTKFSKGFDSETAEAEKVWSHAFHETKRGKKRDSSGFADRPGPYRKARVDRGEFLEITSLDQFVSQLRDPETRTYDELYAITNNAALALKTWQDEYLAIDKLYKRATRYTSKPTANPRKPERKEVFEDKKEASLYGYKYDPRADKIGNQNPFIQGNFKPTTTQMRKIIAKAGPNNPNPDGWRPIDKFGIEHIPKFQDPPRKAPMPPKTTRKRKAAEIEAANADETEDAPSEVQEATDDSPKRRTRARVNNAAESVPPPPSRGTGRGRGRGRGASRMSSRAHEPQAPTPPPQIIAPAGPVLPAEWETADMSTEPVSAHPSDAVMDSAEIAKRQKIANSKNPKRTEAMLNHWARFNREGRVRNPKRTKAQIEADRAADAVKRASEPPKPAGRKRLAASLPALGQPALVQPAPVQPAPMPSLAARGPMAPYAPIDPRAVAHPYGPPPAMQQLPPGQQLQQPPPQVPYHSPYTGFYVHPYAPPPPSDQMQGGPRPT